MRSRHTRLTDPDGMRFLPTFTSCASQLNFEPLKCMRSGELGEFGAVRDDAGEKADAVTSINSLGILLLPSTGGLPPYNIPSEQVEDSKRTYRECHGTLA